MEKKKRYEFQSKVKVPNMQEISAAAGNFGEPVTKSLNEKYPLLPEAVNHVPGRSGKKLKGELYTMKNELEKLAQAVIEDEELHAEDLPRASSDDENTPNENETKESSEEMSRDPIISSSETNTAADKNTDSGRKK